MPKPRGAREYLRAHGRDLPIECEIRNPEEVDLIFAAGVPTASCSTTSRWSRRARGGARRVAGRCETESSGGITLDTLRDYAETGVDFISVGALTHQIRSLDMSLKACE